MSSGLFLPGIIKKLLKDFHNFYEKDVIKMMTTIFSLYHVMIIINVLSEITDVILQRPTINFVFHL